ncbi:MAG: EamA family transporter [Opitutales bacterium]
MRTAAATAIPLLSAVGYAVAALMLKRGMEGERSPWRVVFLVNMVTALAFQSWFAFGGHAFSWENVGHAVLAGVAFFVGQVLTFVAISRGDVSISTPVLGTKVVFVALFVHLSGGEELTSALWTATLLTSVALALLGGEWRANRSRMLVSVVFAFMAAIAFAATDVMQQHWVPAFHFGHFGPVMFLTVAVLSFGLVPFFDGGLLSLPRRSLAWAVPGATFLAVQAMGVAYSIGVFHEVTVTNVLYNTRGLWSVALVWAVGHWFANTEREVGAAIMFRRLLGAVLLLGAVFLCLR